MAPAEYNRMAQATSQRNYKPASNGVKSPHGRKKSRAASYKSPTLNGFVATADESAEEEGGDEAENSEHDNQDEEEDPEVFAPSGSFGSLNGTRTPSCSTKTHKYQSHTTHHDNSRAGPTNHSIQTATKPQKRPFSHATESVLHAEAISSDEESLEHYPRRKRTRRLSNNQSGILAYENLPENTPNRKGLGRQNEGDDSDNDSEIYEGVNDIDCDEDEDENPLSLELLGSGLVNDGIPCIGGPEVWDDLLDPTVDDLTLLGNPHIRDHEDGVDFPTRHVRFDSTVSIAVTSGSSTPTSDASLHDDLFHNYEQQRTLFCLSTGAVTDASDSECSWAWFPDQEDSSTLSEGSRETVGESHDEYESDSEGDTTDEEPGLPYSVPNPGSVLHKHSISEGSTQSDSPEPFRRSRRGQKTGDSNGPRMGYFTVDRNKDHAMTDPSSGIITIIRGRTSSSYLTSGSQSNVSETPMNSPQQSTRRLSGLADDPWDTAGLFLTEDLVGQEWMDLLGFPITDPEGPHLYDPDICDPVEYEPSSDSEVSMLELEDFIMFGDGGSENGDTADEIEVPASPSTSVIVDISSTPARPTPSRSNEERMYLDHLTGGTVTSFRRNNDRAKNLTSLPQNAEEAASFFHPIRTGGSAQAIMTPPRRRRSKRKSLDNASPWRCTLNR